MMRILSPNKERKSIRHYRFMCLMGMICTLVTGIGAEIFYPELKELFWDRAFVFLLSFVIFAVSFKRDIAHDYFEKLVYVLFYVFAIQGVLVNLLNNFVTGYFVILFLSLQVISFSFRTYRASQFFLITMGVLTGTGLFLVTDLPLGKQLFFLSSLVICISCFMAFAYRKEYFLSNLRLNKELLRSLANISENAIFLTNAQGIILDLNQRSLDLFGYDRSEMVGSDFEILRDVPLSNEGICFGMGLLMENKLWTSDTWLRRKNGSNFNAYLSVGVIEYADKRILVYRVRDNTKIKEVEKSLVDAKENAERIANAKSQFLAIMTHEIRTPLNGMIGMAGLLESTPLNKLQNEYVDTLQKSGRNLMILVNDILDFSKFESGKMTMAMEEEDIGEGIREVIDLLRPHAEGKGLQILLDIDRKVPQKILTDIYRVKQVLLNLIGNAIKFTQRGVVSIECCSEMDADEVVISISVKDSGIGIPNEKMHLLFQSFSQIDSS
ncbi:MAG: PAS domain S-box protein, partial [Crocinitomicaceae bacterium]|nr:PAS domain S-box protein [Crocinitomicaceae bacterium]